MKNQKELKISANTISKNTDLTEVGVQRILKGISKNPLKTVGFEVKAEGFEPSTACLEGTP